MGHSLEDSATEWLCRQLSILRSLKSCTNHFLKWEIYFSIAIIFANSMFLGIFIRFDTKNTAEWDNLKSSALIHNPWETQFQFSICLLSLVVHIIWILSKRKWNSSNMYFWWCVLGLLIRSVDEFFLFSKISLGFSFWVFVLHMLKIQLVALYIYKVLILREYISRLYELYNRFRQVESINHTHKTQL